MAGPQELAGHADASAQGAPIHACVKAKGTMRIVSGPADCKANETPLSWNQQGPQGDMGDPGEPGEPGQPGEPGDPAPMVFDEEGTPLGVLIDRGVGQNLRIWNEPLGITFFVNQAAGSSDSGAVRGLAAPGVFFTGVLCSGDAYHGGLFYVAGSLLGPYDEPTLPTWYVADSEPASTNVVIQSQLLPGRGCDPLGITEAIAQPVSPFTQAFPFPQPSPLPFRHTP
jgi:hypothetical protein